MKRLFLATQLVAAGMTGLLLCAIPALAVDPMFALSPELVRKSAAGGAKTSSGVKRGKKLKNHRLRHDMVTLRTSPDRSGRSDASLYHTVTSSDIDRLGMFWRELVPAAGSSNQALAVRSELFDLTIDPVRYPTLQAADGKTILLDTEGTLPPLVRTLIQDREPGVRVVNGQTTPRQLLGAMLTAGGFYSVDEQPVLRFGTDPLLTVRADFKVEQSAESVLRNEVALVSAARQGMPPRMVDYLGRHGFKLFEPFAENSVQPAMQRHRVIQVRGTAQDTIVDTLLDLLAVQTERNRRIELFSPAETGISLNIAAERVFERDGKRYVVARFTGDPVAYTLYRLLATKGYRVIILEPQDTFQTVAAKLFDRMELPSGYRSHLLVAESAGRYSLEMSGFLLENSAPGGGAVMVTDRPIDRPVRDMLFDHGYQVQER